MNKTTERFQVAIVGAGPAGSAATISCKNRNLKVVLIDKAEFPRDKVCGDGIPLKTFEIPSSTKVLDWEIPLEWNIVDAWIKNDQGKIGFKVFVGGGLGRTPVIGKVVRPFLEKKNLLSYTCF